MIKKKSLRQCLFINLPVATSHAYPYSYFSPSASTSIVSCLKVSTSAWLSAWINDFALVFGLKNN